MNKWQKFQKFVFISFLILIILSVIFYQIFAEHIDLSQVRQQLRDFGVWAPAVFIFLYTVGTIFIPSTPFMVVAGILFGFGYGLLYSVIGGFLSSVLVFIIARKLGKGWVESILKNKHLKYINKYNKRLENGATWDLIFLRMTPIMPFNVLNVLMGISKIKTQNYIVGTLLGLAPSNVLAVYAGAFLIKIF